MFKNYIFGLLVCVFLLSCNSGTDEELIINLNKEFKISMRQNLTPFEDSYQITINSLGYNECLESEILYQANMTDESVDLFLNGIDRPVDCPNGMINALAVFNIHADRDKDLNILIADIQNTGKVKINEESYYLNMQTDHGFILDNQIYNKIPKNHAWGYLAMPPGFGEELNQLHDDFIQTIGDNSSTQLEEGNYYYFEVNETAETIMDGSIGHLQRINFNLALGMSSDQLSEYIESLKSQIPNLRIMILTAKGELFE